MNKLFIIGCLFLFACSSQEPTNRNNQTDAKKNIAPPISAGEQLFTANCTSCHSNTAENGIGPGLKGVTKRRDKKWITAFVRNSQAVIASGDKEAIALFNKYNKTVMTSFSFSEAEMDSLYVYLQKL